jgi:hypothetical protein
MKLALVSPSTCSRNLPTCRSAQTAAAEAVPRNDSTIALGPLASSSLVSCVASRMMLMVLRSSSCSAAPTRGSSGTPPCTSKGHSVPARHVRGLGTVHVDISACLRSCQPNLQTEAAMTRTSCSVCDQHNNKTAARHLPQGHLDPQHCQPPLHPRQHAPHTDRTETSSETPAIAVPTH